MKRVLLLCTAMTLCTQALHAQGRSTLSTTVEFGPEVAQDVLSGFGNCYATTDPAGALRLIATTPNTREEVDVYRGLFHADNAPCLLNGSLMSPLPMISGAIAEGLYHKRIPLPDAMRQTVIELDQVRDLVSAARCYIGHQPAQAKALMTLKVGSRKERQAVEALLPEFAKCMPTGAKLAYPYSLIRYRIAESLYRTGNVRPDSSGS